MGILTVFARLGRAAAGACCVLAFFVSPASAGGDGPFDLTSDPYGKWPSAAYPSDPADYFNRRRRALQWVDKGDCRRAIPELRKLTTSFKDDGTTWLLRGHCAMEIKAWTEAADSFQTALALGAFPFENKKLSPNPNDTMLRIAQAYAQAGHQDRAIEWLEKSLRARFDERYTVAKDELLKPLHDHPKFAALAGIYSGDPADRVAGWRSDLLFLRGEMERLHPDLAHRVSADELDRAFSELASRIPDLSDEQMTAGIAKLVGMLRNGHNIVLPYPKKHGGLRRMPFTFYQFTDGLFIIDSGDGIDAGDGYEKWIGSRIDKFGNTSADVALKAMGDFFGHDNMMGLYGLAPYFLALPHVLERAGVISAATDVKLHVTLPSGRKDIITPQLFPITKMIRNGLHALKPEERNPLYLRDLDKTFLSERLPGSQALYVRINGIQDTEEQSLQGFIAAVRREADSQNVRHLILDLRHNSGGNGYLAMPIVRFVTYFEMTRGKGSVFVLIGRKTFSAAHNLIVDIDRMSDAVFVGEPSASSPNAISESGFFRLPYSGVYGFISSQFHQHSWPEDHRIWIAPDIPVALSSRDYFAGRDPALDAILKVLKGS